MPFRRLGLDLRVGAAFLSLLAMLTLAVLLAAPFVLKRELEPVDVSAMRTELFDLSRSYDNALATSEDWLQGDRNVLLLGERARLLLHRTDVFLARPDVREVLPERAAPLAEMSRLLRARLTGASPAGRRELTPEGATRVAEAISVSADGYLRYVSEAFHRLGAVAAQERSRIGAAREAVQRLSGLLLVVMALAATVLLTQRRRLRRAGDSLRDTAQELADAHRIARIGSFRWDFLRDEVTWSDRLADIFGLPPGGRMSGWEFEALVHPDDLAKVRDSERRATRRSSESGRPEQREITYRLRRPDGRTVDIHAISEITSNAENRPLFMTSTVRDVTDETARKRALADSERNLAEAQRIAGLGSFRRIMTTGDITWSEEMYRMIGLDPAARPLPAEAVVHPEDLPRLRADLDDLAADGPPGGSRPASISCRMLHCDGTHRFVQGAAEMSYDEEGRPLILTGTLRDMTVEVAQQEAITRAAEEARRANAAKSDFLAVMSHELRTPMNGVLGMLEVLAEGDLTEEQRMQLGLARSSADALLVILNDILDMSKIEAGRMELERMPFELPPLIHAAVSLYASQARNKGLTLGVEVDPSVPMWVEGDPGRLRQILLNLVSNAVKFTAEGSVTVHVARTGMEGEEVRLTFRVRDTGIGIPEDRQAKVFERFNQLDTSYNRRFGGTGLGLAISRTLTEMMGGTIRFTSRPGEGTEFVIDLPFRIAPTPGTEVGAATAVTGASRPLDILVAEDNATNQIVVRTMLERLGHRITIVEDGAQAVAAAAARRFDIILMDMSMPRMDGLEATRHIRAGGGTLPILALTAHAGPEEAERCRAAGIDDLLSKPIRRQALAAALAAWSTASPSDTAPAPAPAVPRSVPFDLSALRDEFSGAEMKDLIAVCLSDLSRHAATLQKADASDAELARACHSVAGLARTFGAVELGDRAADLERHISASGAALRTDDLFGLHDDLMSLAQALRQADTTLG